MSSNLTDWDRKVAERTGWCHFVQSSAWAEVKGSTAWQARELELPLDGKSYPLAIYCRNTPGLGKIYYAPKIATLEPPDVRTFTVNLKKHIPKALAIRVEIDQPYSEEVNRALLAQGWQKSDEIQYQATVLVDLDRTKDELFSSFKKRVRWECRTAERAGVTVEKVETSSANLKLFFEMLGVTSMRGNFRTRSQEFSNHYWELFSQNKQGSLYFARLGKDVLSAAYVIQVGDRAYYKDGASTRQYANLFASRLMQWQIMQDLQKKGCKIYDLCGVMRAGHLDAKNKGLYTFKTGFAEPVELQGSYILPLSSAKHKVWQKIEPIVGKLHLKFRNDLWY